jgi:hypothetical protein
MAAGNDKRLSYQTGVQVAPATNAGALNGLLAPARGSDQRANDFAKMTSFNDQANMGLASQQANAQQMANAQAKRSEASISGLNNQQQIAGDMNQRANQQTELAAQVQSANIGFNSGMTASNIRRMMNIWRGNA